MSVRVSECECMNVNVNVSVRVYKSESDCECVCMNRCGYRCMSGSICMRVCRMIPNLRLQIYQYNLNCILP